MGVKELSAAHSELFDICRRNDVQKLKNWIAHKKGKRPKTPLNIFRPVTPNTAWLTAIKDPNSQYTVLHAAALVGNEGICRTLLDADIQLVVAKDKRGCIPLHLAAWNGHYTVVKLLIDADRESVDNVNNAHETALHLSAQHGHSKIVQLLLDNSADVHIRNARSESPLDIAARTGHAGVCKILATVCPDLALKSAVECSSTAENGCSAPKVVYPMHAAARHSHVQCLQILRLAGFDVNYVTSEGSALHVAAMFGQVDAVRYLLQEGINTSIRDSSGRTVLQLLEEHESQKASDLTQVIQSKQGWGECRRLIEDHIGNCGTLNSSSDSGIDRPDSDRSPRESRDAVWKLLPGNSSAFGVSSNTHTHHSTSSNGSDIYHPPSLNAEVINMEEDVNDLASTISISTRDDFDLQSQPSPSTMYDSHSSLYTRKWFTKTFDGRAPRFPLTSPNTHARHSKYKRIPDSLPISASGFRTQTLPHKTKGTILPGYQCVYKAPPGSEIKRIMPDGTVFTYNPSMSYDNVPDNSNARQWVHECGSLRGLPMELPDIRCQNNIPKAVSVRSDGTQTLPTPRPRTRPSVLSTFASIQEDTGTSPRSSQERDHSQGSSCSLSRDAQLCQSTMNGSTQTLDRRPVVSNKPPVAPRQRWSRTSERDREDSLGITNGLDTREGSRASTVTFACSTLERSISPITRYSGGRAPLALPEELTGSTSTSIMSSSLSPERNVKGFEADSSLADESSLTMHQSDAASDRVKFPQRQFVRDQLSADTADISFSSLEIVGDEEHLDPPSPFTSQNKIFEQLCGQPQDSKTPGPSPKTSSNVSSGTRRQLLRTSAEHERRPIIYSPQSPGTDCSEATVASSCSLPVVSQISTTPPSIASPRREMGDKQFSVDQSTGSSIEVKMRNPSSSDRTGEPSRTAVDTASFNELAEWKRINEIMESYGGGICRESVFAAKYEPQVAVFLRDRKSKALTIHKRDSAEPQTTTVMMNNLSLEENRNRSPSPNRPLSISDWLNVVVGIPNPKAAEVGALLETHGFDKSTQLKISLDRSVLSEIGVDKSIQHQILSYLETLEMPSQNALHFTFVSDWLCSLELTDYLGNFVNAGLRSMLIVRAAELDARRLHDMGIRLFGHVRRLLGSLELGQEEEKRQTIERKTKMKKQLQAEMENKRPPSVHSSNPKADLLHSGVTFSAHYLGSMEISNIDGTEESRRAMNKLKNGIREIAKVPHVQLEISVMGVKVFDAQTKNATASHDIVQIQIVCQDERDLNCFAYITQERDRNFAHVFCVLTADVATEIIMTLGSAFELAYSLQSASQHPDFGSLEEVADI